MAVERFADEASIMGTSIEVELFAANKTVGMTAIQSVFDEMHRINELMSPYNASAELYQLNHLAAKQPVTISRELYELIKTSVQFSEQSGGAFDVTFASIGFHYDFRNAKQPNSTEIVELLPAVNYRHIDFGADESTQIAYKHPNVKIDLGGIAKGHAVDRAIDILRSQGITSAIVSAGGDSKILGDKAGSPWFVGIQHPRSPTKTALTLPLVDTAISTSGDYERFFFDGEQRIHHIINPRSGKPSKGLASVTIIAPTSTQADALSTTVFVLGKEAGMALVETIDGVDVVIIDENGNVTHSTGLQ